MWQNEYYNLIQVAYLKGQLALLPLYALLFLYPYQKITLQRRVILRNVIAAASIALPLLLICSRIIPKPSFPLTETTQAAIEVNASINNVLFIPSGMDAYHYSSLITVISIFIFCLILVRQLIQETALQNAAIRKFKIGRVTLIFSNAVTSPFSTGLLLKTIYCPARLLHNRNHLEPILAHEAAHIRKAHLLIDIIDKLHISIGWYNPLSYLLMKRGVELREFECDRSVLQNFSPKEYGTVLLSEAESLARAGKWALSSAFINHKFFKRRFTMLFERQENGPFPVRSLTINSLNGDSQCYLNAKPMSAGNVFWFLLALQSLLPVFLSHSSLLQ